MKEKQITIFHNNIYTIEADLKSTGKFIQLTRSDVDGNWDVYVSDVTALTQIGH